MPATISIMSTIYNPIRCFHTAVPANQTGIGNYLGTLAEAGVPLAAYCVQGTGSLMDALHLINEHGATGDVIWRPDKYSWGNVPQYHLSPPDAANNLWGDILAQMPPELKAQKDKVWIETMNEVDKNEADWIGQVLVLLANKALTEGYKIMGPAWATGEPELDHWTEQGLLDYAELCSQHPDRLAVSVHEYSLDVGDIWNGGDEEGHQWLVGRIAQVNEVWAEHGIHPLPTVFITEFGYTYQHSAPSVAEVKTEVVLIEDGETSQLCETTSMGNSAPEDFQAVGEYYATHAPNVRAAFIWTLASSEMWGGISNTVNGYMSWLANMVIDNPMPPPIEPPLPEETKQEFIWRESVDHQIAYGISWNPSAGLARAITQNKMVPVTSEFYRTWEGKQIPLQVGEDRKANLRLVFSWENNSVHVWVKPEGVVTTKHQYIWDESILFQQQKGISWNPTAALAKAIIQAGLSPMTSEFYIVYKSPGLISLRFPVQVGENLRSGERLVFSWENGRVYAWSKPAVIPDPDEPDPEDPPPPPPTSFPYIGLHFSADPDVGVGGTAEFVEFKTLRPEVIKVMTAHNPESIRRLHFDNQSTNRKWIVRVFYKWHDDINADTFVSRTIADIRRTISTLLGVGVSATNIILEIHNEPNLASEGMWVSWQTGAGFGQFFERVVTKLKPEFPLIKFGFPGLSPGGNDPNRRYNAVQFLNEASTYIARSADVVCMHLYWLSLADLENQIGWIRNHLPYGKPVYITECSNPTPVIRPGAEVGAEYAEAIKMIANYGGVTGLTFFVGSASNSKFHPECFVINQSSRGIAQKIREDL